MQFENFIGIDIGKESMEIYMLGVHGQIESSECPNCEDALERSLKGLMAGHGMEAADTLICAEHTGHYGNKLIRACERIGMPLWMESGYAILHSQGISRGKDDKLDAERIALYAKRFADKARLHTMTDANIERLALLHAEREGVVKDIAKHKGRMKQEKGFLDKEYLKGKHKRAKALMAALQKALKEIERLMDEAIASDPQVKERLAQMESIDGVGRQTAVATMVATHNFTKFDDPRKFCCHIGCAPFRYVSGSSIRSANKVSHRANKKLKRLFHMAALAAIRSKGELSKYYERKVSEGKRKMSVINAIRGKLVHRIFALVKQGRKYEKNYIPALV